MESCSATVRQWKAEGQIGRASSSRSSRTITRVRPAGPMFFWAPAKITPYFDTSIFRDRMCEDMSATIGTFGLDSGTKLYSTPSMVSLVQMCR